MPYLDYSCLVPGFMLSVTGHADILDTVSLSLSQPCRADASALRPPSRPLGLFAG